MQAGESIQEHVAGVICHKATGMSFEECYAHHVGQGGPCRGASTCPIAEKTNQQLTYATHRLDMGSFLRACPGSGKTEVVAIMAAYNMGSWNMSPAGIAILTFTNNAANVIADRVGRYTRRGRVSFPHFVGTIDRWLYEYVAQPFGYAFANYKGTEGDCSFRIIDSNSSASFLNAFWTQRPHGKRHLKANEYYFDDETGNYALVSGKRLDPGTAQDLDDLRATKERFWKKGFATHQDMEHVAYRILEGDLALRKRVARRFPYLIVDECQDLSWVQIECIKALVDAGAHIHLVGDLDQAIYGFRRVDPAAVNALSQQLGLREFLLTENFRSVQPIVDLCGKLVAQGSIKGRDYQGADPCCGYVSYRPEDVPNLPLRFEKYVRSRGGDINRSAVLTRGRSTLALLRPSLGEKSPCPAECLATAIKLWQLGPRPNSEALVLLGDFLARKCIHAASTGGASSYYCPVGEGSHLRWRLFLWRLISRLCQVDGISNLNQSWQEWIQHVQASFERILMDAADGVRVDEPKVRLRAPGSNGSKVSDSLGFRPHATGSAIRTTLIHQVKGETLEAVLLVSRSDKKGDGGHWSQWVESGKGHEEHARFAYVACSRAERLLVWAVPEPNEVDAKKLEAVGLARINF